MRFGSVVTDPGVGKTTKNGRSKMRIKNSSPGEPDDSAQIVEHSSGG